MDIDEIKDMPADQQDEIIGDEAALCLKSTVFQKLFSWYLSELDKDIKALRPLDKSYDREKFHVLKAARDKIESLYGEFTGLKQIGEDTRKRQSGELPEEKPRLV